MASDEYTSSGDLNQGWTYRDWVQRQADGQRVLDFYAQNYPHSTQEVWQQRIEAGLIRLDHKEAQPDTLLRVGQQLSYHRPPWREPEAPRNLEILHEDAEIIAVAKPSGLPVLPGGDFLDHTLLAMVRRLYMDEPAPIHRLGRGTSGIVIFARSPAARQQLSADLREGRVRKLYRALACGTSMPDEFAIEQPIGRVSYPPLRYVYAAVSEGKYARTECRVLQRDQEHARALLEVDIPTGRPHQIRIHLAAAGYPLVGEPLYCKGGKPVLPEGSGRAVLPGDGGYHLHAWKICFTHPGTRMAMTITCTPPEILRPGQSRQT